MTERRRRDDWPERLLRFVEQQRRRRFAYGKRDCVMMAASWVWQATGFKAVEGLPGSYADPKAARRVLKGLGHDSLEEAIDDRLGEGSRLEGPAFAQRGDVALFDGEDWPTLGVCIGGDCVLPARGKGLVTRPTSEASAAWRV